MPSVQRPPAAAMPVAPEANARPVTSYRQHNYNSLESSSSWRPHCKCFPKHQWRLMPVLQPNDLAIKSSTIF